MSRMMGSDSTSDDGVPVAMVSYLSMFCNKLLQEVSASIASCDVRISSHERSFGGGLITATACGQKYDRRKQIV